EIARAAAFAHLQAVPSEPASSGPGERVVPLSPEEIRNLRRFGMLLERLPREGAAESGGAESAELARQLLVIAASGAASAEELETRLARLQELGAAPAVARNLIPSIAAAVPDWAPVPGVAAGGYRGGAVEAVRRVVMLAGDRARSSERWKELLRAAARSFNEGAVGRAATLVDLAGRLVAEGEVDAAVASITLGGAHEAFDPARLLEVSADEQHRPVLRRLVEALPAWSVGELLDQLADQPDQKRRRLAITLLEVWGTEARGVVLDRLASEVEAGSRDPNSGWFLRNLVYLLHRLPRRPEDEPRRELELVAPYSALGNHPSFQREVFLLLADLPGAIGVPTLLQRLTEAERALQDPSATPHDEPEMWKILNSLAMALARAGTAPARRALIDHALAQPVRDVEAMARLRELGGTDLSDDRWAVDRLLAAARELRPVKVLGLVVGRNEEALSHVVRALASTTDGRVRELLADLAARFPDREFGRLATGEVAVERAAVFAEISGGPAVPSSIGPAARASLSGDLEVFGLAGLLQNLQQSEASGRLLVRDGSGSQHAAFDLLEGRLVGCRSGRLKGEAAFYQVFEVPQPGTFEFVRGAPRAPVEDGVRLEVMALLMEAMRRFDELQQARIVVPDDVLLRAGDQRPTAPPEEGDGDLVRKVWTRVRGGATARECELEVEADCYRIRTLLAHWLESGALRLEAPGNRG
ncbi:MAG TPA: DUF4388 domain-containing protein, partial [Thermoanaerobaculia bacterium]|nr:DUF4388 domain-containing protein [Thermoanaerobaculia bacterium]